jgi:hypothetical protein
MCETEAIYLCKPDHDAEYRFSTPSLIQYDGGLLNLGDTVVSGVNTMLTTVLLIVSIALTAS